MGLNNLIGRAAYLGAVGKCHHRALEQLAPLFLVEFGKSLVPKLKTPSIPRALALRLGQPLHGRYRTRLVRENPDAMPVAIDGLKAALAAVIDPALVLAKQPIVFALQ